MVVWTKKEIELFEILKTPNTIQEFLNSTPYDAVDQETNRSPRYVIKEKRANCFEGALLAAAVMEYYGHQPRIIDMSAHNDDDHLIMVYQICGHWGAIAKSNTTTLRGREPVYDTPKDLIMSYFDFYFNVNGDKTLRGYTRPVNLNKFNKYNWRVTSGNLDLTVGNILTKMKHNEILTPEMALRLNKADSEILAASLLGSNPEGLYKLNR